MTMPGLSLGGVADLDPALVERLVSILGPIIAETHREYARKIVGEHRIPLFRVALVTDTQPADGIATIVVDGDGAENTTPARYLGFVPSTGARVLALFTPGGGVYVAGPLGKARLLLPPGEDVGLESGEHPFQIGYGEGPNLRADTNEIQCLIDGDPDDLFLNELGGAVHLAGVLIVGSLDPDAGDLTVAMPGRFSATEFLLNQQADGDVVLNAPDGKTIFLQVAGGPTSILRLAEMTGGTEADVRIPLPLPTTGSAANVFIDTADSNRLKRFTSSLRRKRNIAKAGGLLAAVRALRPVRYNFRDDPDGAPARLGLIAEEVAEGLPPAALYDTEGLPDSIDLAAIAAALVGSVQELAQKIERLEAENKGLRRRVVALETRGATRGEGLR